MVWYVLVMWTRRGGLVECTSKLKTCTKHIYKLDRFYWHKQSSIQFIVIIINIIGSSDVPKLFIMVDSFLNIFLILVTHTYNYI